MAQRGKGAITYRSVNAGELSPFLDIRSDLEKYRNGCKQLKNAVILPYGGFERRQGLEYIAAAKYDDKVCRVIEFEFSTTTTFAIEVGEEYMRFYTNGAQVMSGGSPYEISTPYQEDELFDVQFEGINDIVYFVHPNHPQRKLTRLADDSWTFSEISYEEKTAFLEENTDKTWTMAAGATTGTGVALVSTDDFFDSAHVGGFIRIGHERESTNTILPLAFPAWAGSTDYEVGDGVTESSTLYRCIEAHTSSGSFATDSAKWTATEDVSDVLRIQGAGTLFTTGFWRADILLQTSENGTTGWKTIGKFTRKEDSNISVPIEATDTTYYRIKVENWTANKTDSGVAANTAKEYARVTLEASDAILYGVVEVTAVSDAQNATVTVIEDLYSTSATDIWAEGAWSEYQGFPRAVCFHEERIVYGGTARQPQRIWLSRSIRYDDFRSGVNDDDSFSKEFGGRTQQRIEWMISQKNLIIGTKGAEFIVTSGNENIGLTPSNANLRLQTAHGSKHVRCLAADDAILYVTRDGRKLREFISIIDSDGGIGYKSPDLTLLAEHISGDTDGGFKQMGYMQNPVPAVWCVTESGELVEMTYYREQNIYGWAPMPTTGTVESCAVITGEIRDEVWVSVKRTIDGDTKRFIERIRPTPWSSIEDAFYVDCGTTYDGVATTTVSAPHLPNTQVSILADGRPQDDIDNLITLNSNGEYELAEEASVIHVGLKYETIYQPMRLDVDEQTGDSTAQEKAIRECVARFIDTVGGKYGDGDTSRANGGFDVIEYLDTSDLMDTAIPPFTGDVKLPWDSYFSRNIPIILKQDQALPMTLAGLTVKFRVTGNK